LVEVDEPPLFAAELVVELPLFNAELVVELPLFNAELVVELPLFDSEIVEVVDPPLFVAKLVEVTETLLEEPDKLFILVFEGDLFEEVVDGVAVVEPTLLELEDTEVLFKVAVEDLIVPVIVVETDAKV
ncbi:hypothetical protein HK096_006237, partial [Nowakowskiella sp. JEL0078]